MAIASTAGVTDFCTCDIAIWTVLLVVVCVCLMLATGPYYYYISVDPSSAVNVSFFTISAAFLILVAILGIVGAMKKHKGILLYFGFLMIVMVGFTIAQISLTMIALTNCLNPDSFFSFMCEINKIVYFAHSTIIVIVALISSACAFLLRWRLKKQEEDPDNKY
eukprot:TRINITY_DN1320_c1_g4_i1.p1 TRINITY_DN1320_c1_g4~~TRINITY_DN1320_c1_g4_i1.p1  ORF type:complete len:164 (+),score=55.72 TRINITY_DN1320_c1_g4_i1:264-755(+)